MPFILLVLFSALFVECIGTYVSVVGLGHTFNMNPVIITFAVALDLCKVTGVSFLYKYWKDVGYVMRGLMVPMMAVAMLITSAGVGGYLTKQFQDAIVVNNQDSIAISSLEEEKGRLQTRKQEIDKQIANLPADYARARRQLMQQFAPETDRINKRLADIDVELPKLKIETVKKSADLGPILYIAQAFETTPEQAVKWVILLLVFVFDPLAITLLIAANFLLERRRAEKLGSTPPPAVEPIPEPVIPTSAPVVEPSVAVEPAPVTAAPVVEPAPVPLATQPEPFLKITQIEPQEAPRDVITMQELVKPRSSLENIDHRRADVTMGQPTTSGSLSAYKQ